MLDTLGLIPKSMAPAIVVYLVLCYGLGDVFAERLARRVHIPACQSGLAATAAAAAQRDDRQQREARELLGELFRAMPGLSEIPGASAIETLTGSPYERPSPSEFSDRCACLASAARAQTRFDQTIWVASLRLITPPGVSDFAGVMAGLDRQGLCTGDRS